MMVELNYLIHNFFVTSIDALVVGHTEKNKKNNLLGVTFLIVVVLMVKIKQTKAQLRFAGFIKCKFKK